MTQSIWHLSLEGQGHITQGQGYIIKFLISFILKQEKEIDINKLLK